MQTKQRFAIQSLIITVAVNAVLLTTLYVLAGDALQASGQLALLLAAGVVLTFLLWLLNYVVGSRLIGDGAVEPVLADSPPAVRDTAAVAPTARPQENVRTAEAGAVQLLAILQRQGRLLDFLREDLQMYDDAQIGAAVRSIHAGCRQALDEHVRVEPIFNELEGNTVSVQPGFDPRSIRLTGNVVGEPPFRGELRHRGWRVVSIDLPQQVDGRATEQIVAAAEVEVQG